MSVKQAIRTKPDWNESVIEIDPHEHRPGVLRITVVTTNSEDSLTYFLEPDPATLAMLTTALWGEPVIVIRESELPELDQNGDQVRASGRVTDSLAEEHRRDALLSLARARLFEAEERVKAEDARRAPWRTWLDERTEANDVSWVAIDDVARALVDAGVQVPEGGAR